MTRFLFPVSEIIKVIDGDSVRVRVDLGFKITKVVDVRIEGVDAPEVRGSSKKAGKAVRGWVADWLEDRMSEGLKLDSKELDKYGRSLGDLVAYGKKLSTTLLVSKLAKPYDGGPKSEWAADELKAAQQLVGRLKP